METPLNDPFKNPKEHPRTYVIQDQFSNHELTRLDLQDRMVTERMGGLLSEQPDPSRFRSVLDVGCGPGWWLIEVAKAHPHIIRLAGIDISGKVIDHARAQAEAAGVSDRVKFQTNDALRLIDFPDKSFDLVNLRFGVGWLKKWDWPRIIREFQRVSRHGGIVRITEGTNGEVSSPALTRLFDLLAQAFYQAGHFFSPGPRGLIDHFAEQMEKYGVIDVQTKTYIVEFYKDPHALSNYLEVIHELFELVAPFIKKWVNFSEDYKALYQQMVNETQQPGFEARSIIITAWGEAFKLAAMR